MIPSTIFEGLGMVMLGAGGIGASQVALHFDQPFFALGYLLSAVVLLMAGIVRLVRA